MFGTILLTLVTLMHIYVFQRLASSFLPPSPAWRYALVGLGVTLWLFFVFGRIYGHGGTGTVSRISEIIGLNWMAVLFLLFLCLAVVDVFTLFGVFFPQAARTFRVCAVAAGLVLSAVGFIQGARLPVVSDYTIRSGNLPGELDGLTVVALSDLHLGHPLLGPSWLAKVTDKVETLKPDLVLLLGDVFEGHGAPPAETFRLLSRLSRIPSIGAWSVLGNHESHGGGDLGIKYLNETGFPVLNNRWEEVRPGLVLAGVEDLTRLRRSGSDKDSLSEALSGRPPGMTILLSHTPWEAEKAAGQGVDLMLSGHTHGGQIWPFGLLVGLSYKLLAGYYDVAGLPVIVCRGTGLWGPRMRLWLPGEILHLTLRKL